MRYTVNFLFTPDGSEVLLVKKNKTSYKGKLNGVGGKCEEDESFIYGAIREIREETGAIIPPRSLHYLGTLKVPYDCSAGPNFTAEIYFYSAIVNKYEVSQQEDEELIWMNVADLLYSFVRNDEFAGDGDVLYMINNAVNFYNFKYDKPNLYKVTFKFDDGYFQSDGNTEYVFAMSEDAAFEAVRYKYEHGNDPKTAIITITKQNVEIIKLGDRLILDTSNCPVGDE